MAKRAKPEDIIAKLREVEVRLSQGESVGMAAKSIGVTEQTYYRWRKEYGGLQVNQAKRLKKVLSPSRKRQAVDHVTDELDVSERRACRVVGQHRSTQRRLPTPRSDQENLTQAVINLAKNYGRCGYLRITALRSLGKMSSFRGLANRLALFSL